MLLVVTLVTLAALGPWNSAPIAMGDEIPQEDLKEQLALTIAPPMLLADGNTHRIIYLQFLDSDGAPQLVSEDIEVLLVSSDPRVVRVPSRVFKIRQGRSYTVASLTTTSVPGQATITAVSDLGTPVTAQVETVGLPESLPPFRLTLEAAPPNMILGAKPSGMLSVMLLGASGTSALAPNILDVVLSSSNPEVVRVARRVTIPQGAHFAVADLEPLTVGSATISAIHSGYVSEFIEVQVVHPGEQAEALVVYLSPPVLRLGTDSRPGVIVQATDLAGLPVPFPPVQVDLASSSPLSAEVSAVAAESLDPAAQVVMGTLTAGSIPGTVTITAVANGMRPATATLDVQQGRTASQLEAYLAPLQPLDVEDTPGFIVVQVLDDEGFPMNSHDGIVVTLVGNDELLQDEVVIPKGKSFVTLKLDELPAGNQRDIYFVNPSLSSAHLVVGSHSLPTSVQVVASAGPAFPGDQVDMLLQVESAGRPLEQAKLTLTAFNGTLSDTSLITDEKGEARAVFLASAPGDGRVEVTVQKAGYDEASGAAPVAVVAELATEKPRPSLLGFPVWYLFLAIPALVLVFLGIKLLVAAIRKTPQQLPSEA